MRLLLPAVAAVVALALATAVLTTAQDAVEEDEGGVTVTNELGTPCAAPPGTPVASPMAFPDASPAASPMASPAASPAAIVIPGCPTEEGTPGAG